MTLLTSQVAFHFDLIYHYHKLKKMEWPRDLCEIYRQCLPEIEADIPPGIYLETDLMKPGPVVLVNSGQMRQIFTNLIVNAKEAIEDSAGAVKVVIKTVTASEVPESHVSHIDLEPAPELFASLEVTDSGCGISGEKLGRLFDPFYTTKFTGRGLGLAVTMGLVKAWGGMLRVESSVGEGSCFHVFLPLVADAVPRQTETLTALEKFNVKGTVLLVDDDPVLCSIVKVTLRNLGCTVFVASGGSEALELFELHQESIDCLLTDLSMPDMDGWETLAALRKIKPNLPAILSSGYDEAHVMKGDHNEQPQAFLHKPYRKSDLKNVLGRFLRGATRNVE